MQHAVRRIFGYGRLHGFARRSRAILFGAAVLAYFALAAPAVAAPGRALLRAAHALTAPTAACPAGTPVQPITVVNQANASRLALARVEAAVTDQSMQLRAAWGTPCVTFRSGGWPLYLRVGGTEWGYHYTQPVRAEVYTGGQPYVAWSQAFSHEIVETLVDPTAASYYYAPGLGLAGTNYGPVEVADPVEDRAYKLDGAWVSDFVFPAYFAGALQMPADGCDPAQNAPCGPPYAAADASGPYDQMGILTRPWDTTWQRAG